jgi:putative drug exporter of the RND superfamily
MFGRLGRFVTTHPWWVIGAWIVAVALIVPVSPSLSEVSNSDQTSFIPDSTESMQAQTLADEAFPAAAGTAGLFVVSREDGAKLTPADTARVDEIAKQLDTAGIERVTAVSTGEDHVAPNGKVQLVDVAFDGEATDEPVQDAVKELRGDLETALADTGLEGGLTGDAPIQLDSDEAFGNAETITFVATIALIIILVGAIFRSPVAAFLPILTIGLVFSVATSLVALVAKTVGFEVDSSLTSLLIVVLFGIGTDYILFLLFRYRERLRAGDESRAAVAFSVRRVGEAVASSALVVVAAFLALLLADLGFLAAMAPGLAISVAVMLVASITLIPAVISLVGPRVFWPSKSWRTRPESTFFKRLGQLIARRPGRMALASGGALVALAAGALFYTASYDTSLPSGTESTEAYDTMKSAFPAGALNPTEVYVSHPDADALPDLVQRLERVDGVASVSQPALSEDGTAARITVTLAEKPDSQDALDTVAGPLRAAAHVSGAGEAVLVGGSTSQNVDLNTTVNRDMSVVFPIAAAIIFLILALLLRSVVAPLYLLGAVALGFAATLGAGVLIFQLGAGSAGLIFMIPIMLYLFVVAIGTDYNILMTSRLREEVMAGNDPRTAADLAVEHAGPTVASAGIILAGTFASLSLTGVGLLVQLGVTIALGVVIVSMLMAIVFVPSVSALVGRGIWWPSHREAKPAAPAVGPPQPAER